MRPASVDQHLRRSARPPRARRALVLGLGNPDLGDDAVGRLIARRLQARQRRAARTNWLRRIEIAEHGGDATGLIERLEGAALALLIDACHTGAPPGTVHRFDASDSPLPVAPDASTHSLGLASALELARALGQLPARCVVYGIEVQQLAPGASLSDAVSRALEPVEQRLIAELAPGDAALPRDLRRAERALQVSTGVSGCAPHSLQEPS